MYLQVQWHSFLSEGAGAKNRQLKLLEKEQKVILGLKDK